MLSASAVRSGLPLCEFVGLSNECIFSILTPDVGGLYSGGVTLSSRLASGKAGDGLEARYCAMARDGELVKDRGANDGLEASCKTNER